MSDFYEHKDNWYKIQLDLTEHKDNAVSHITSSERTYWNAKSDAHDHPYAPLSHVGDATHLADGERESWNGKATTSDIATAISTHNTTVSHGHLVPDYKNSVVVTGADNMATYTAQASGIIYITDNMNTLNSCCDVYVNNVLVSQFQDGSGHIGTHTYMLASGDVIKLDCTRISGTIDFLSSITDLSDIKDIAGDSLYVLFVPFKTV